MAACVWQAACVLLVAQVRITVGAVVTVKTAEQVLSGSQVEVTVQVTVLEPPHAIGADPPLLDMAALQPPVNEAVASHALYAASIAD